MKSFTNSRKFLFGVSVSMVLAMAIGSFALSETQTPASPRAVEVQNSVGANAGAFTVIGGTQGTDYDFTGTSGTNGVLTIHPQSAGTNITISNDGTTTDRIEVTSAATITLAGVDIDRTSETEATAPITITDDATFDVNILLADGSTNILKSKVGDLDRKGSPGIQKNGAGDNIGTLAIGVPDGSAGTGKLEANGGRSGAGIGGGHEGSGSNIIITGGVVTANGGRWGAGIGGGFGGDGSNITITGGEVTATGGEYGAGIGGGDGGGDGGIGSDIRISGGVVTATGGSRGAGIGSGRDSIGTRITITGGVVTATGRYCGAGIGGGSNGSGSDITISGGEVTATGGYQGTGIGGGYEGSGSGITINGGVVTATGGDYAAGIGDGYRPSTSGSGNSLNGDAVVLATSGSTTKAALGGFVDEQGESLLTQGIAFTRQGTSGTWSGAMYGNVTLSQDLEIPANLTVPVGQILSIKEGKDVTLSEETGAKYTVEGELRNNGTVTLPSDLAFSGNGKVTTLLKYDPQGGTFDVDSAYQLYQDINGTGKTYQNLPQLQTNAMFNGWNTEADGTGNYITESTVVVLNFHTVYADMDYTVTFDSKGGSEVDATIAKYNVALTKPTPDPILDGYSFVEWCKDEECTTAWDFENDRVQGDMTLYAKWIVAEHKVIIPTNPDDHGTVTTDPENPKTGDEVIITVTPEEGYKVDGLPIVKTEDGRIIEVIPTGNPNEYKFIMPDSDVTIEVNFVLISEPTVDPGVKTGDSFAGIAALAILGLATTGAALVRKRK